MLPGEGTCRVTRIGCMNRRGIGQGNIRLLTSRSRPFSNFPLPCGELHPWCSQPRRQAGILCAVHAWPPCNTRRIAIIFITITITTTTIIIIIVFLVFCLRVEEVQVIEACRSCVSALEDTAKEQSRHRYTMAPVLRQRGSTQAGPIGTLKVSCTKAVLRQRGSTKAAPIGTLKIYCSKAVQLETNTWTT